MDNEHNSLIFGCENMLRYLSLDIICSEKRTVLLEVRSRKTVRFSEQIMSADKYLSIFSRQMKAIVYIFTGVLIRLVKESSVEDIHVVTRVRGPSFLRCLNMAPRNFLF